MTKIEPIEAWDAVETTRYTTCNLMGAAICARAAWWMDHSYRPERREAAVILLNLARICATSSSTATFWGPDADAFEPEEMTFQEMRDKQAHERSYIDMITAEVKAKEQYMIDMQGRG